MNREDLRNWLRFFQREAFRLELRNEYQIPDEAEEFARYLRGEPIPASPTNYWTDLVSSAVREGKLIRRVHILPEQLTPYLRFEIEWEYVYNAAAGEDIYLLRQAEFNHSVSATQDFWLFDESRAAILHYDRNGAFQNCTEVDDQERIMALVERKNELLQIATPLRTYLAQIRNQKG